MTANDENFYRPQARTNATQYPTEELRERKRLADAIVANLKAIHSDTTDLETLERRLASIATAIAMIKEDEIVKELDQQG